MREVTDARSRFSSLRAASQPLPPAADPPLASTLQRLFEMLDVLEQETRPLMESGAPRALRTP